MDVLSREKGACKGFREALPPARLAGAPGLQGCGQGLRPSGWPLIKRGLGREPVGQPSPWAFPLGPLTA